MQQHILVPTDGSEHSLKAAAYAGELARAFNARVSLLSVLDGQAVVAAVWGSVDAAEQSAQSGKSREDCEADVLSESFPETIAALGALESKPETAHAWGHPASEICDYAKDNDVDQIFMGSHGRTGIRAALLGSVSHGVVNRAHCTVTIVR
ncbi:MAG: universal stress protein [Pseudomonadota bacterium]